MYHREEVRESLAILEYGTTRSILIIINKIKFPIFYEQ